MDLRRRPYPKGLILSAGAFPIFSLLLRSWRRCASTCTVQVPSEQPALLDWLMEFLERFVLMLMSVLECGLNMSLTSSGLTNWLLSKVLSAARLKSLFDLCSRTLLFRSCFALSTPGATVASRQQQKIDCSISCIVTEICVEVLLGWLQKSV